MDNPDQWAVELWRKAQLASFNVLYGTVNKTKDRADQAAALAIQAAFAEREARLRELIAGLLGDLENIEESAALTKHRTLAALKDRTHG